MRIPWLSPRVPGDSGSYRAEPSPAEQTAHENAASIHAIPRTHIVTRVVDGKRVTCEEPLLPDGPARAFAISEAMAGKDVFGYASGGERIGTWCIWYGPLCAVRQNRDARIPASVWAAHWEELAIEAETRPRVDFYGKGA